MNEWMMTSASNSSIESYGKYVWTVWSSISGLWPRAAAAYIWLCQSECSVKSIILMFWWFVASYEAMRQSPRYYNECKKICLRKLSVGFWIIKSEQTAQNHVFWMKKLSNFGYRYMLEKILIWSLSKLQILYKAIASHSSTKKLFSEATRLRGRRCPVNDRVICWILLWFYSYTQHSFKT